MVVCSYLDDVSLMGTTVNLCEALRIIQREGRDIGFNINLRKTKVLLSGNNLGEGEVVRLNDNSPFCL